MVRRMDASLYFNPSCSKCRTASSLLDELHVDYQLVRYLDEPQGVEELRRLMSLLGIDDPRDMMRPDEPVYGELELGDASPSSSSTRSRRTRSSSSDRSSCWEVAPSSGGRRRRCWSSSLIKPAGWRTARADPQQAHPFRHERRTHPPSRSIMAAVNAGKSGGQRDVTRSPSTTTAASSQAPGSANSSGTPSCQYEVRRRPRTDPRRRGAKAHDRWTPPACLSKNERAISWPRRCRDRGGSAVGEAAGNDEEVIGIRIDVVDQRSGERHSRARRRCRPGWEPRCRREHLHRGAGSRERTAPCPRTCRR